MKIISRMIVFCLVLGTVLSGCGKEIVKETPDPLLDTQTELEVRAQGNEKVNDYPIRAQYIRTNGYNEGAEYPRITVVRSVQELNGYYDANKVLYDLERKETVYSDTTIGFLDACDRYDAEFFANYDLILVLLEEGSGSIRHEIWSIKPSDDHTWVLNGVRKTPGACTDDMAEWHFIVEIEKNTIKENDEIILDLENWNSIGYWYGYMNMELALPDDWEYSIEEHKEDEYAYGISFWPSKETDGKLRLNYYTFGFGVCGTGLSQVEYTFDNGEKAYIGTYDNNPVWDFISFRNTPGDYAVINEGIDDWWEEYKEEAVSILNTIQLANGVVRKEEAIAMAKDHCTVEYDMTRAKFNFEQGIWEVVFGVSNPPTVGGGQTVKLDARGGYIESEYGE